MNTPVKEGFFYGIHLKGKLEEHFPEDEFADGLIQGFLAAAKKAYRESESEAQTITIRVGRRKKFFKETFPKDFFYAPEHTAELNLQFSENKDALEAIHGFLAKIQEQVKPKAQRLREGGTAIDVTAERTR